MAFNDYSKKSKTLGRTSGSLQMTTEQHTIDLDLPPGERWVFLADHKSALNQLLRCYLNDLEDATFLYEQIDDYGRTEVSDEYLEEINSIASISDFSEKEVLIANLYYDALKFYLGCTAFGVNSSDGILHARNLDWWTDNNLLSEETRIFDFQRKGKTVFKSVSWPGFVGALSGTSPGRFSLTLNAVSSTDPAEIASPVTFLLRDVLCHAENYEEAKNTLENTTIASDCLLLLTGTKASEMAVIERTPRRSATRGAEESWLCVANDYKLIENDSSHQSILQTSSCGRYDRACSLLRKDLPRNLAECMSILSDEQVKMNITVQQMVFDNKSGEIFVVKTNEC